MSAKAKLSAGDSHAPSHLADSYQRWFCVGNKSLLDELGHFDRLKLDC